jgi:Putative prokaryotic signal transducing protein
MTTISPDPAPLVVWYGDDPVALGAILAALEENEISTYDMAAHSRLEQPATLFQGPCYSILVHANHAEEARKLIRELVDGESGGNARATEV